MIFLKNHLFKGVFLCFLSFFFVSCGSINYFKKPQENKESKNSDKTKISALESEVKDAGEDQANLKLQIKDMDKTMLMLQEKILDLEKKVSFLEKKKKASAKGINKNENSTPLVLYRKARNFFVENNFIKAAALFKKFIKKYPQNSLADNASYWLGECHYSLGNYKEAILVFKNLVTRYPKSEKVPDAILKIGYSYLSLDDSNRAHHFLKKVITKYPFSPAAEKSLEKLKGFE
ncbi:MAG: tol-pal system protein YbgF [Deltaproteobacteria bacterium]|nr:tol-pal system protein YbgF [Deltaproteobacteria bacterium]